MPSQYCLANPNYELCQYDPNYDPGGTSFCGTYPNDPFCTGVIPNFPSGGNQVPVGVGNAGGWPGGQQGTLSQILNSILSGAALITNHNYVPTPLQTGQTPQGASGQQYGSGYGQYPTGYNPYASSNQNVSGQFQKLLEQHPAAVAAGAIALVLLLIPRPSVSAARR